MPISVEVASLVCISGIAIIGLIVMYLGQDRPKKTATEKCPEDSPRVARPPGHAVARRLDLTAMVEGRLSLDEYIERWSGREILNGKSEDIKKAIEAEVLKEFRRPVDPASPKMYRCPHCLGLHLNGETCPVEAQRKALAGVSDYVTHSDILGGAGVDGGSCDGGAGGSIRYCAGDPPQIVTSQFRPEQWVRVLRGGRRGGQLVKLHKMTFVAGIRSWEFKCKSGALDSLAEECFMVAVPINGEWWEKRFCSSSGRHTPEFTAHWQYLPVQWSYTSGESRGPERLCITKDGWDTLFGAELESALCGCLVPVNFGRGYDTPYKPDDKVRIRGTLWADRIVTLEGMYNPEHNIWRVEFGGSHDLFYEYAFEPACPKKGEVWNYSHCLKCDTAFGKCWSLGCLNVDRDWILSDDSRARINCGCLYRIGTQDKKG